MKIPRAVFRYVEYELYGYEQTKKEIQELREDMLEDRPALIEVASISKSGQISDPTAQKVTRLLTSRVLKKMADNICAIDRALSRLNDEHRQLFVLKYLQALPWQKVRSDIPISDRTYFRLRRELVSMVAVEMGLILAESWQE